MDDAITENSTRLFRKTLPLESKETASAHTDRATPQTRRPRTSWTGTPVHARRPSDVGQESGEERGAGDDEPGGQAERAEMDATPQPGATRAGPSSQGLAAGGGDQEETCGPEDGGRCDEQPSRRFEVRRAEGQRDAHRGGAQRDVEPGAHGRSLDNPLRPPGELQQREEAHREDHRPDQAERARVASGQREDLKPLGDAVDECEGTEEPPRRRERPGPRHGQADGAEQEEDQPVEEVDVVELCIEHGRHRASHRGPLRGPWRTVQAIIPNPRVSCLPGSFRRQPSVPPSGEPRGTEPLLVANPTAPGGG